jgi:DHA1 family bicyclomycin/chloramphenicol resistance-like MFS transporter
MSTSVRTILPLAIITCTSMLAMDLYLPAVPVLQRDLGISVAQGQATIAVFLAGLACSQLVWGEALHRFGPRACVKAGLWLLVASSVGSALAPELNSLLAMRLLQGIAAGASTVVSPTVIRATLPAQDGVRGIAAIAMIEAIVPAAGPVLGTLLLFVADWRVLLFGVGLMALVAMPFALQATPRQLPNLDARVQTGYRLLLTDRRFLRLALSHAACFAALLTFVGSGPQVLVQIHQFGSSAFAVTQVCGVAAFIVAAGQSGRISARLGSPRTIQVGAWGHVALCAAFLAMVSMAGGVSHGAVLVFWMCFCALLGIKGPATFSEALSVPVAQMGRASALMVLILLVACALATQAVAPYLERGGLTAVASAMLLLSIASLSFVARYPAARGEGVLGEHPRA